jgi:hypothetical protein
LRGDEQRGSVKAMDFGEKTLENAATRPELEAGLAL